MELTEIRGRTLVEDYHENESCGDIVEAATSLMRDVLAYVKAEYDEDVARMVYEDADA